MKKFAPVLALISAIFWAGMGIVTRYVATIGFTTRQNSTLRLGSAAMAFVLYMLITDRKKLHIKKEDLKWFFGSGILSLLINNITYATTVQLASLSVAVVLLYTAPFFVMILSIIFFKERLTVQKIIALILSFTGCILVVGVSDVNVGENAWITLSIGLLSGFAYSLYSIFGKILVAKYDAVTVPAYTFIFGFFGALCISSPVDMFRRVGNHLEKMPLLVLGGVLSLAVPYLTYSIALKYIESSKASIIASFEVVAASLFGVVLYHEKLDLFNVVGIICVVAALICLQIKLNKRNSSDAL